MKTRPAVRQFPDYGAGDRTVLRQLCEGKLALTEDALAAKVLFDRKSSGGAAQPMVNGSRRDDCNRKAKAREAQTFASRTDQGRPRAQNSKSLQEASIDAEGNAAVGGSLADPHRLHHVRDRHDAVPADIANEFPILHSHSRPPSHIE